MTGAELFNAAAEHAQSIAFWRQRAAEAGLRELAGDACSPVQLTRRQCLTRVRYGQARVIDLAILAEKLAGRQCAAAN